MGANGRSHFAMQKVEGSSPFIRFRKAPETGPFCCRRRAEIASVPSLSRVEGRSERVELARPCVLPTFSDRPARPSTVARRGGRT
jgi:hypothetical protein